MANAKKCDRCGKCFDLMDIPSMVAHFSNPVLQMPNDVKRGVITRYLKDQSLDRLDLCPECTGEFTLFMEGCPLSLHKNDFDKPDIKETVKDTKVTDEEDKEYQKTAFQKFLDKVDQLGNEFFKDLEL